MKKEGRRRPHRLRDSVEDSLRAGTIPDTAQSRSSTYRLAFTDRDFLLREELRPVRLQLELLKPQMALDEAGITSTVVMFGSARIPAPEQARVARNPGLAALSHHYAEAQKLAEALTRRSLQTGGTTDVVCTGGGPGIMEAGNRGAAAAGGHSIGLNIVLPHEQVPNPYVTPELCFNFHYFAMRKMHFLMRAKAICIFPGGFGTLDEMFESLTLIQSGRMEKVPFLLFGRAFWEGLINWQALVDAGTIAPGDLDLFRYVEDADEAFAIIESFRNGSSAAGESAPG
ncbi:MAG: TIGR00730 family Rossman fold protein [Rubellimicrobium sp.]|nr:TIGR00730 family Rossman fold protein [Rubellimicrobium sp.]